MKRKMLLIITNFFPIEENISYFQKEIDLKIRNKEIIDENFSVKFFHPQFQGQMTLDNFIKLEESTNSYVYFLGEVPREEKKYLKDYMKSKKQFIYLKKIEILSVSYAN